MLLAPGEPAVERRLLARGCVCSNALARRACRLLAPSSLSSLMAVDESTAWLTPSRSRRLYVRSSWTVLGSTCRRAALCSASMSTTTQIFPSRAVLTWSDTHSMSKFRTRKTSGRPHASRTRPPAAAAADQCLSFAHSHTTEWPPSGAHAPRRKMASHEARLLQATVRTKVTGRS